MTTSETRALELLDVMPVGKGRPRFSGNHAYTPARTREYEAMIRTAWIVRNGSKAFTGRVTVACEFCFLPPLSWSKKRRADALAGAEMVKKPDCDNLLKAILDALNGIAYQDDAQVQSVAATKRYTDRPAVRVWVTEEAGQ